MNDIIPTVAQDILVGYLLAGDAQRAERHVSTIIGQGVPPATVIAELLGPAMATVGLQWQQGHIPVIVEHRATSISEGILSAIVGSTTIVEGKRVWLTGVEGEWHTMPTRLVGGVWRCLGWDVVALIPSLPAEELELLAAQDEAVLAGVSCSLAANLVPAWRAISVLRTAGFRILAGGRAFDSAPDVAAVLGADAHLHDPLVASDVLKVWSEAPPMESRGPTRLSAWQGLHETWWSLPAIVEDAIWVAREIGGIDQSDPVLREDLTLIARTSVAAVLCDRPQILQEHLRWYRALLETSGFDPQISQGLLSALDRVLPAGSAVRGLLAKV